MQDSSSDCRCSFEKVPFVRLPTLCRFCNFSLSFHFSSPECTALFYLSLCSSLALLPPTMD